MTSTSATALLTALMLSVTAHAADKKAREQPSGFDPKSFLLKLVSRADKDGDGSLSIQEFQKLPLLREVKKEKLDEVFVTIDADFNGALSTEEVAKGLGKITDLVKAERSTVNDADTGRHAKKLKRVLKKPSGD